MTDDDRPKRTKSWREIDKMRDKSGPSRRGDRDNEAFQRSSGYTKYKSELDRLFSGGAPLPEHLRDKADPKDLQKADELKKLLAVDDAKAFYAAAREFLKSHELPDDPRLLDRLLGHPDDTIVEQALSRLETLHRAGTLKAPPALATRLSSVEIETSDPAIRKRAAELRKALR